MAVKTDYYLERSACDDITFCMTDCGTDCGRQPKYIRDMTIPHSFSDFGPVCRSFRENYNEQVDTERLLKGSC